jgi:excisionase family DNA binding protein
MDATATMTGIGAAPLHFTIPEVAARFRVCRRTIEREIARGLFPAPVKIGRLSRISEADIQMYLEKSRGGPPKPP